MAKMRWVVMIAIGIAGSWAHVECAAPKPPPHTVLPPFDIDESRKPASDDVWSVSSEELADEDEEGLVHVSAGGTAEAAVDTAQGWGEWLVTIARPLAAACGDVTVPDCQGNTALHYAVKQRDVLEVARILDLLRQKNQIDVIHSQNKRCKTALQCAYQARDAESALLLMQAGAVLPSNEDVLTWPIVHGHTELALHVLGMLVRAGKDLNERRIFGETLLHEACVFGRQRVVAALLEQKADPWVRNERNELALHLAAGVANRAECGPCSGELPGDIEADAIGIIGLLLQQPLPSDIPHPVQDPGRYQRTPVMYAAERGWATVVTHLVLHRNACVNVRDEFGFLPSDIALRSGHVAVGHMLQEWELARK